jgi:hypothetical protein
MSSAMNRLSVTAPARPKAPEPLQSILLALDHGTLPTAAQLTPAWQPLVDLRTSLMHYVESYYCMLSIPTVEVADLFRRHVQPDQPVIEIGAGRGLWANVLQVYFGASIRFFATDLNPGVSFGALPVIKQDALSVVSTNPTAALVSICPRGGYLLGVVPAMSQGQLLFHAGYPSDYDDELRSAMPYLDVLDSAVLHDDDPSMYKLSLYRRK